MISNLEELTQNTYPVSFDATQRQ